MKLKAKPLAHVFVTKHDSGKIIM